MAKNDGTVMMEGAKIIWRNFAGRETPYNREGDRNFNVIVPENLAKQMVKDGWNVKFKEPKEEGDEGIYVIQVSVGFKGRPPTIVMIGSLSNKRNNLGEDECEVLDYADIVNTDLIIRPYSWNVNGKSGIKAYLKTIYVTINEDPLELKYNLMDQND